MPADSATLIALIAAAILEEIVFRLGVQEALLRWQTRRNPVALWPANVMTAALFAIAHALLRSWKLGLFAFPAALALGLVYERKRRVWMCIALHLAFNVLWFFIAPLVPIAWLV